MSATVDPGTSPERRPEPVATDPAQLEAGYYEYRRACYAVLYRHARERGLLDHLREPRSSADLAERMGFHPDRMEETELFLRALVRFGALTFGDPGYVLNPAFDEQAALTFDPALIGVALGKERVESVIHGQSYAGIVDALSGEESPVSAEFGGEHVALWEEFLQAPFYRFGRERAVDAISAPGAVVLDLAAGPGFGLLELADEVGDEGVVTGAEVSHDFVYEAARRTETLDHVQVIQCNLDAGLPFLRDEWFDGAMLVGALHYIRNREMLFRNVARVLKPGGRFCLALVHMHHGTYDQELMDLRLRLRRPPASPATRPEIEELAARHGLELLSDEFSMGVYGWFLLVKGPGAGPAEVASASSSSSSSSNGAAR